MTAENGLAPGCVLVLGGRSEIGVAIAERIAAGRTVVLAARRSADLLEEAARLQAAGAAEVVTIEFDADDLGSHQPLLERIATAHGPIGVALVAFGVLGDQGRAERDSAHAAAIVHTDFTAQVSVLTTLTVLLRAQDRGHVVVFSSIAGVRVRRANYVYGAAKAGLDGFASGLGDALAGTGVRVMLVRPGFVIGAMTAGMKPAPMSSTPAQVADAVVRGLHKGHTRVWVPGRLRLVAMVMRVLPQWMWRRMPR